MLALLQRLLPQQRVPMPVLDWLAEWAHLRGDELKQVRAGPGFVLANEFHGRTMRVECGVSQRDYIGGNELRLRYELGVSQSLEMLVISRSLAEVLERRTFDDLTHHQQTQVTADLPEEARWLAMFERVDLSGLPAALTKRFVVVASQPALARQWLEGDLSARLARATGRWLGADLPLVLMTLRGRLYVRTEAQQLDPVFLSGMRSLADTAALSAMNLQPRRPRSGRVDQPAEDVVAPSPDVTSAGEAELRALDAAILNAGSFEFEMPEPMAAFADHSDAEADADDFAISGMTVVYSEPEDLPPINFQPTEEAAVGSEVEMEEDLIEAGAHRQS